MRGDCCNLLLKTTEEDQEEEATKRCKLWLLLKTAAAAALSEAVHIFTLQHKTNAKKTFLSGQDCFAFRPSCFSKSLVKHCSA